MNKVNFFDRQASLRRITRRLSVLTAIGCTGIACLGGVATGLAYFQLHASRGLPIVGVELQKFVLLGAAISLGATLIVMIWRLITLHFSRGSARRFFGARDLNQEQRRSELTAADRRLYNVVDEMRIAANTTAPHVFVIEEDYSINSFALAQSGDKTTIGITAGARDQLSREELQALVAHELGHLANGDAAINVRLLALIQGFRWMYDTSVSVIGAPFRIFESFKLAFFLAFYLTMIFGAFFVLGLFGIGIARLMQAAIARQREFLADASAVQFTRATNGLLGALEKAGNYEQSRRRRPAHKAAFMMFVSPYRARSWLLRTHPRIEDRIAAAVAMTPGFAPARQTVGQGTQNIFSTLQTEAS